ncbi:hypothetical protein HGRIS_012140 [Hohenbuehelia grisea]|uniref:Uncharacterized protein n=1 Tax=Hohenbuehelia grisea TaxID=104357 RepID=A0ABR3IRC7_9AGAR
MLTGSSYSHRGRRMSAVTPLISVDLFSDARTHPSPGPSRNVRLPRVTTNGNGAISKSPDGMRCAVVGNDSLRIVRISDPSQVHHSEHKSVTGRGGYRIDASRNYWEGNGLSSANTDVAWCSGVLSNKIVTSARNGEICMWDINKSGASKCERREKGHHRSIHALAVSPFVEHYCVTGSADGDLRIWDLRDMSKSLMKIRHQTSIRAAVFSPNESQPLQAVVGLENGSLFRWDLKMGQRGQLDRVPVAHTGIVTTLDWCNASNGIPGPISDILAEPYTGGMGWLASGGLDNCVKIWDLTTPSASAHIPHKPTYVLHPSFPVRRIMWRPGYACEIAVVSNAEFGTGSNPDLAQTPLVPGHPDFLLDQKLAFQGKQLAGDPVEIWDARRGWIAKWAINGSAGEGGVTDIEFGDANALWALHSSGAFSQIDVRNSARPIDAVSRVATSWQPGGSLAFVTDRPGRFEIPYDDITPSKRAIAEERRIKFKALGDLTHVPNSQNMGVYHDDLATNELEIFEVLARGYIYEGKDRVSICETNADVAYEAGNIVAAQTWLLLGASLTDLVPESMLAQSPSGSQEPVMSKSKSAPAVLLSSLSTPDDFNRSFDSASAALPKLSPIASRNPMRTERSLSATRRITPTSSNSSSPHLLPGALPPITPRRPSVAGPRESASGTALMRRSSLFRRQSTSASTAVAMVTATSTSSTPSIMSASPNDWSSSTRYAGEGALDDSDSDSDGRGHEGDDNAGSEDSSEEESDLQPLVSPALSGTRTGMPMNPSPLSQVAAGRARWTEESSDREDSDTDSDDASPSPRSTDTEHSGDSDSPTRNGKRRMFSPKRRRRSAHVKSRSRSSTVASLAAPGLESLSSSSATHTLAKHESRSSIRTVIAGEVSFRDTTPDRAVDQSIGDANVDKQKHPPADDGVGNEANGGVPGHSNEESPSHDQTERRSEVIIADEDTLRDIGWEALREAVGRYADDGDVQMCAMLALVAPKELRISPVRCSRYVEAYLDVLTRLRLFACCAYIRKYTISEQIRELTLVQTLIYTSCGKCRKPLAVAAGNKAFGEVVKGGFAYCLACKQNCVTCAICRLPVRSLLFQCAVCSHGGHQLCYKRYYSDRPMEEMPVPAVSPIRGRVEARFRHSRDPSEVGGEGEVTARPSQSGFERPRTQLFGHACAAGCGHFCWAANQGLEESS